MNSTNMGGHALKTVNTQRINNDDYQRIKKEIYDKFHSKVSIYFLNEIPGKETHGDLDLLYVNPDHFNIRELILQIMNPKEIVKNGPVLSFSYLLNEDENMYFQIDFIHVHDIDSALFYFSYSDFGQILGKILKYYGLTFGHNGLWISPFKNTILSYLQHHQEEYEKYNINEHKIGDIEDIILTRRPEEICKFFGLSYDRWKEGFQTKIELFEYIKSSHYFSPEIFLYSNHPQRSRLKTRKMYEEFLIYLFGEDKVHELKESKESTDTKENHQLKAILHFEKEDELKTRINLYFLHCERKMKFNGNLILQLLHVTNKELGLIIPSFKKHINEKYSCDFEEYLDKSTKNQISEEITNWYYHHQ